MSRNALPESEENVRDIIRAAEAAVMAGAARERERRVHRWECGRCAERMETPKPPAVAGDGCVYCPRCADAIRPFAPTAKQLTGIDDVSPREARAAAKRAAEERLKAILADQRTVILTDFNEPEKAEAEHVRSDTPAPPKDVQTDTEETKKMAKKKLGGARALPEPWKCPTPGCGLTKTTAQAVGAHRRWCPRKGAPKLAAKSAPPTPAPSGTITSGWAQEIRIDPPTGATFVVDMKRGPIARFAGVEVELASVEDAVAFVRAMQTSGQQSAAGSVSAKG